MTTNAFSGALSGASSGFAVGGPIGAVVGGTIGAISGGGIDSAERDVYRANRSQERRKNEALLVQSERTGESGARLASQQRAAFGAAGIEGATPASVQFDTAFQTYRDQLALLAGVSNDFQGRSPRSLGQKVGDEVQRVSRKVEKEAKRFFDDVGDFFDSIF